MKSRRAVTVLISIAIASHSVGAQARRVDLNGMILNVSDSWTAQVFHIVDQLSEWDRYTHRAYLRWAARALVLDSTDRRLLRQHADLRRATSSPKRFDEAWLVEASIAAAAQSAVSRGLLTTTEAAADREILEHFASKVASLRQAQQVAVDEFIARVTADAPRLSTLVRDLARFAEAREPIELPVFVVSNPDSTSGGGEANGGRLVIEVPAPDPMGALIHEALHAFLAPHAAAIRAAADSAGLSFEIMNEGLTYAMAPGLTDDPRQIDRLAAQIARFQARGTPRTDPYVQSYTLALLLRPSLRGAVSRGETLTSFLPVAVRSWKAVSGR